MMGQASAPASMSLAELLGRDTAPNVMISGLQLDSRMVHPGDLFLALPGEVHDGRQFIEQAVANGAAPSLAETKPVTVRFFLDRIVPEAHGMKAGAIAGADALYSLPAEKLVG